MKKLLSIFCLVVLIMNFMLNVSASGEIYNGSIKVSGYYMCTSIPTSWLEETADVLIDDYVDKTGFYSAIKALADAALMIPRDQKFTIPSDAVINAQNNGDLEIDKQSKDVSGKVTWSKVTGTSGFWIWKKTHVTEYTAHLCCYYGSSFGSVVVKTEYTLDNNKKKTINEVQMYIGAGETVDLVK
ncbi:hypothetical protein Bccel_4061 [Pseudobacteroides cellulosolvens ATCC 35603 = DSM 2933]|uniref:Uncharacterized protein n=2 Tax=Pseudobacteroides cellulosolvens TaxID=35825 RepID=A0A0L6JTP9_9FIRM|nr:hypothetical protein Bccel_4061 [Pseudobacteroides cellulosolvens ATCC 35603 = DSM 2933]